MNVLTKLASAESSRLEKIAAAVAAIEEGYNPEEVIAFASEQGIAPEEVMLGANLFGSPVAELGKEASAQESDYIEKIASVIVDEDTVPLVKVAAAVDLFAAGALDADEVYGLASQYGFDQADVDHIFATAYPELAKEASAASEGAKEGSKAIEKLKALLEGTKDAYKLKNIREAFGKEGDKLKVDWGKLGKGVAQSGAAYGVPIGAAAYAYNKSKSNEE